MQATISSGGGRIMNNDYLKKIADLQSDLTNEIRTREAYENSNRKYSEIRVILANF